MVSSPGNQSDLPTSPCEVFALYFSVGVVVVLPCIHLVVLSTSDCPLAKVRASPDTIILCRCPSHCEHGANIEYNGHNVVAIDKACLREKKSYRASLRQAQLQVLRSHQYVLCCYY